MVALTVPVASVVPLSVRMKLLLRSYPPCAYQRPPQFWMNLQSNYDLDLAEYQNGSRIRAEVQLLRRAS